MNRQPLYIGGQTFYHYDEDIDRRENLPGGIILAFVISKTTKRAKESSFRPAFLKADLSWWVGGITNRKGFHLTLWNLPGTTMRVEINNCETQDRAIELAELLLKDFFP